MQLDAFIEEINKINGNILRDNDKLESECAYSKKENEQLKMANEKLTLQNDDQSIQIKSLTKEKQQCVTELNKSKEEVNVESDHNAFLRGAKIKE